MAYIKSRLAEEQKDNQKMKATLEGAKRELTNKQADFQRIVGIY